MQFNTIFAVEGGTALRTAIKTFLNVFIEKSYDDWSLFYMFIIGAERAQGKKNLCRPGRKVHTSEPENTAFPGVCERGKGVSGGMKNGLTKPHECHKYVSCDEITVEENGFFVCLS